MREVLNGLFYLARSGCSWRMLPHDFPPVSTLKNFFYAWQRDGTWEHFNKALRQQVRAADGREAEPSAAIIDSQSVKTTESSS